MTNPLKTSDLELTSLLQGLQLGLHQRPGNDDHHHGGAGELCGLQGHLHQLS